jgi:hypothetical protein
MKCYGCGIEKDLTKDEIYPWPEDERLTEDPIPPLLMLECQRGLPLPGEPCGDFKAVIVCHSCFHKLDPDMWIGEACWRSISPVIPFDNLPPVLLKDQGHEWESVSRYPDMLATTKGVIKSQ